MKKKSTLGLLIAVLLLGACIWLQESWRARMPSREYRRVRLFELDGPTLSSIRIRRTNTVIRCQKDNGGWISGTEAGGMGRADTGLVERMVAGLNAMGKGSTITTHHLKMRGLDASEYGFDEPLMEIEAVDNKGRRSWQIGRRTPLGDMVYVREGRGGNIFTIHAKVLEVVPAQADDLRDRTLFAGDISGVRRVEIRGRHGFIQMLKDLESGWQIQQPISVSADAGEVERYINKLMLLRVDEFLLDNVSDFSAYGLQNDRQIALSGVDGKARMLELGNEITERPGFVYARRADDTSVFAMKKEVLELLQVEVDRFRNADVLALAPDKVSDILIARGDDQLRMAQDTNGVWRIETPVVWEAEKAAVDELLKLWSMAVITDFEVPESMEPAQWSLQFGSRELRQTNSVAVLAPGGKKDGLVVICNRETTFHRINLPMLPVIMGDPLHYKNREIWQFDPAQIRKVAVRKNGEPAGEMVRLESGSYAFDGGDADPAAAAEFMERLAFIRTSEYVAHNPEELAVYGLVSPSMELHVNLAEAGDLGRVLLIGRETPRGFYSMVKGRDVVFFLSKRYVDLLNEGLAAVPAAAVPDA